MKTFKITLVLLISFIIFSFTNSNSSPIEKPVDTLSEPDKPTIKVALLLDTSNSMDGLIDQAKSQLWKIVNELSYAKCEHENPNLKIALYEYGNDDLESSDNFIRKVVDFSSDLDEISERLFSLDTNGGEEYCGAVIKESLSDLKWGKNKNDLNIIFIAGNEAFTQGKVSYKNVIADAVEKDVVVNTIFCGDYDNGVRGEWKKAATLGEGEYLTINQNKQIVHIPTPYDEIIIRLNRRLNKTYIRYGNTGARKMARQATQDDNAMEIAEEVVVARAVSKSSLSYSNASWDLVDAKKEKNFDYSKINKKQLSKDLQNKSTAEIKKHVEKQSVTRIAIQKEIQEVNKQRNQFLLKNKKSNTEDELESVMINAIKKQAKRKNYSW